MGMRFWVGEHTSNGALCPSAPQPEWRPHMGARFAEFEVQTTQGFLNLKDWAAGSWVYLFSHPNAFTPVCTSEILALADATQDFNALNCKILGITATSVAEQTAWHEEIEDTFDVDIEFPVAEDPMGILADALGLVRYADNQTCSIRKSFILDPDLRVRMIYEYPEEVGRNTDETLRCITALQASRSTRLATPADWKPGDRFLNARTVSDAERAAAGPMAQHLNEYMSLIDLS